LVRLVAHRRLQHQLKSFRRAQGQDRCVGPALPSCCRSSTDLNLAAAAADAADYPLQEVACVVDRLYSDPRAKEARVGEAASYQQYQELKACTFKPEINREVPKQQVGSHLGTQQQTTRSNCCGAAHADSAGGWALCDTSC
jgi:hypothetical protein